VRKIALALVVLLFLASATLFLRYVAIHAALGDPKFRRAVREIAAFVSLIPVEAGMAALGTIQSIRAQADFALYLSIATALFALLYIIALAATRSRRRTTIRTADAPGLEACPECGEPIRGFEITCRACGSRLGPRSRAHRW
jgi:ribosomal protein L32